MHAHPPDAEPTLDTPYAGLTPALVLDALDAVGLRGDGRLLQLNSYENRVFQVYLEEGGAVVAKFYRPGRWSDEQILEEHRFSADLMAEEIPVVAPLELIGEHATPLQVHLSGTPPSLATLHADAGTHRFAATPWRSGGAPSLESLEQLERIGRFIGRMHVVGARRTFVRRLTLNVEEFGRSACRWLCKHAVVPPDALLAWHGAADQALDIAAEAFDRVKPRTLRLHGDCHLGNLLWSRDGPHFVDLDDALNGPAIQDLWMLMPAHAPDAAMQVGALLRGYETFTEFDDREMALVEPLRTLRLIHHSAWIAKRWADPAFPIAFPWFAGSAYWQQQTQVLREQIKAMQPAD